MPRRTISTVLPLLAVFALSMLSCGREITGPEDGATRPARGRFAYLAVDPQFPTALVQTPGAGGAVPFEKVRIVLRREDGSIALDTLVDFPIGADEISLTLQVPIPTTAPATGLPLALNLNYINAAGQTVFSGGPINITAIPTGTGTGGGNTPTPVSVPISYTGPGAGATAVRISPKTGTATAGGTFTFSAEALNAAGEVLPNTPVIYSTPDPTKIQIVSPTSGQVRFLAERGVGRITATLLTGPTDQAAFDITLPASRIAIAGGNAQKANAGSTLSQLVSVRVSAGDDVPVADVPVTFAVVTGGGSVTTATGSTNASGIASTSWRLGATVGAQTLQVSSTGLTGSPLTFTADAIGTTPTKLVFVTGPANGTAAQSLPRVTVAAQDAAGNLITAFTGDVAIALGANPSTATLSGTRSVAAVGGIATFSDLRLDRAANGFTLVASSGTLTSATSSTFNIVPGSASNLVFTQQPSATVVAGVPFASAITVAVRDASGNVATGFTGPVSLRLTGGIPNTPISGTTSVNAVAGVATFAGLSIARSGANYTVVAEAPGVGSASSDPFAVRAGAAKTVALTAGGGQTGVPGIALAPITVLALDQFENPVAGVPITFTVLTGSGATAPATATTVTEATSTFALGTASTIWTLGNTIGTQTLRASVTADPSVNFVVSANAVPGAAARVVITTEPATTQVAGASLTPALVATVKDAGGFTTTNFSGTVTLGIVSGPTGATLTGTASTTAVAGVATFSSAQLPKAGANYRLEVASAGLAPDTTIAFGVQPAVAASIAQATPSHDLQTGLVNAVLPLPFRVQVTDALGNGVSGTTVNWAVASGGGTIAPTSITGADGIASATLTLPGSVSSVVVNASALGLAGSPVAFTAIAQSGAAATLAFITAPASTYTAGSATGQLVLEAKDAQGNRATSFAGSVTVAIATGPSGASIGGTTTVHAVAGVARFNALSFATAGDYTLAFTSEALPTLNSAPLTVTAAPAASLIKVSGDLQSAVVGAAASAPLVVRVTDGLGNRIAGVNVSWNVVSGGGSVTASSVTNALGEASATWTAGSTAGAQTAQAAVAGLTGSPVTFSLTATAGAPAALVFTTHPPATAVAGESVGPLVVQARDAFGNVVSSFTGNVSVIMFTAPPGGGLISGSPTVAAVAGVATFSGLALNKVGVYRYGATSGEIPQATSSEITITAAAPAVLTSLAGGGQSGVVGQLLPATLQVKVTDAFQNPVSGVVVSFAVTAGGGSLASTTPSDAGGIATSTWTLGTTVGAQSVTASVSGLNGSPVTFTATATAGAATALTMSTQPSAAQTAGAAAGAIIVAARDAAGNIATSFSGAITMSILTGPPGATILGTAVQNATNGELNFGNIAFNKTGSYVLQFTSPGLASVNSASFSVSHTAGDTVAVVAGNAQTGPAGQPLATPLQVRVVDRYGNAVPGHNVTFAVASGGGSVTTAPATDAAGRTSATWTLGTTLGAQTVTATADFFLHGSPITFSATATATTANRIWTGATSSDWNTAGNWTPTIVPAPTDSVLIPSGTANAPVLPTSSVAIRHLRMESGTTLAMSGNDLTVAGDVEGGTITGSGIVILSSTTTGTVRGTLPALRVSSAASYSVSGTLQISGALTFTAGSLEVGTQSVTVGANLEVSSLGLLRMTGAGSLTINGDATFAGASTAGMLTNGTIDLMGSFTQSGSAQAFQPSGAHRVRLTGTSPQVILFNHPDSTLATTCTGSCFATLESVKAIGAGGVIFNSVAKASGTLSIGGDSVSAPGRRLIGNAVSLTANVVRARNVGWGTSLTRTGGTFAVDTLTAWGTNVTLPLSENLPTIVTGTANTSARHYNSIIVDGSAATLAVAAKDTIFQHLITRNGGRLAMQQASDTLIVLGNATFNGGSTVGLLTAGRLDLHGSFTQGGAADAFHADPDHSTWLRGSTDQSVTFANPGSSHFGDLYLSKSGGAAVLESDVEVDGELETGVVQGHQLRANSLRTIRSHGADVRDLRFTNVRWELRDGSAVSTMDDIVFQAMPTTVTQFDIQRSSGAITLSGITFQTTPTTGKYLRIADPDGATGGALDVTVARPNPSNHNGFAEAVAPATLTGWPGILAFVWQGNVSSDWNTAANWSASIIPGAADSVVIPSGRTNYPVLSTNTQVKHLAVGANASLNFSGGANLGVLSSMINAPSAIIGLDGLINLQGAGPKTVQGPAGNLYINGATTATGTVTTSGDLRIFANGSLTVNGQAIIVADELFVGFGALLRMTNAADTVLIGTHATWNADAQNSSGQMTAGFLRIGGNFTATGASFSPSGSHRTEFNASSSAQAMTWATPGGGQFHHLTFRGAGTKTLPSEARVTGDILIASTVTSPITSNGGHIYWSGSTLRDSTTLPNGAWGATATQIAGTPTLLPNRLQTFLKVAGTLQLTDSLRVMGPMDVSGLLDLNGRKLVAEQSFVTWGTGRVAMANAADADSLIIKGDALFKGGASTLTKGRTIFGGAFRQCPDVADCGSTAAFAASGSHRTEFNRSAAGDSVVAFSHPTTSFFNDLRLATALTIRLESDVKVAGTLSRSSSLPAAVPVKSDTLILPLMTVAGIIGDITYPINFTSVRLKLTDGTANVLAQKLHFTGFPNNFTGTVFEISRTTPGGVTLTDVIFTSVNLGSGGKYIRNNGSGNANPSGTCNNPLSSGAACP